MPRFDEDQRHAAEAVRVAEQRAREASEHLVRAQAASDSSQELAASARNARLSELRAVREAAAARRRAASDALNAHTELRALEAECAQAQRVLDAARREVTLTEKRRRLASLLEEARRAQTLADGAERARLECERHDGLYEDATRAVLQAETALQAIAATLDAAVARRDAARHSVDDRALAVRQIDVSILQREASANEAKQSIARAIETLARVERDDQARTALNTAEAQAAEVEARLTVLDREIQDGERELELLGAASLFTRRQALIERIEKLRADAADAEERRQRAATSRKRAAECEDEGSRVRLPMPQQVRALEELREELRRHDAPPPSAAARVVMVPLIVAVLVVAVG